MIDAKYPPAVQVLDGGRDGDGYGWGPLPDRGGTDEQICVTFHTTETNGLPGYNGGQYAPHFSYLARERRWLQHGRTDCRMGTLKGSAVTGVLGNELSVQVEIVGYSDAKLASARGGLWVGDFGDAHYADLAAFIAWCRAELGVTLDEAYGPPHDFATFLWGKNAATRLSPAAWLAFRGLTAHGAVPGNDHWDTGVLDLHRVIRESKPAPTVDDWDNVRKLAARIYKLARRNIGSGSA